MAISSTKVEAWEKAMSFSHLKKNKNPIRNHPNKATPRKLRAVQYRLKPTYLQTTTRLFPLTF